MEISIISFTRQGAKLSLTLAELCRGQGCNTEAYSVRSDFCMKEIQPLNDTLRAWTECHFREKDLLIFVGACGIAVRSIAPFLQSKYSDPGVIVTDDKGQNMISLLSGHLGGANDWARLLADKLSANPVITTASDIHQKLALDLFAANNQLHITDRKMVKTLEAAILEEEPIGLFTETDLQGSLPANFYPEQYGLQWNLLISPFLSPRPGQLWLIPKVVTLGIGCRRGKSEQEIEDFVQTVLSHAALPVEALHQAASIDIKASEPGLSEFAASYNLPLLFYTAEELEEVSGEFSSSSFVKETTGTDNICERAAVRASQNGQLIIQKQSGNGITVAAAIREWSVSFE